MNILVVENDTYLAQKIVTKLLENGYSCDLIESSGENLKIIGNFDVVLLSTSMPNINHNEVIKKFSNAIIILLASYMSDETVSEPIKNGAMDYVLKPFVMDELLRKINHYQKYKKMQGKIDILENYLSFSFRHAQDLKEPSSFEYPMLVETNSQAYADKIVFDHSLKSNLPIKFLSFAKDDWKQELEKESDNLLYFVDYHLLKKNQKESVNSMIIDRKVIICSLEEEENFPYNKHAISKDLPMPLSDNIVPVGDYVRLVITNFQDKYPDVDLAKKLGISRKALWEKRKKYNIDKKR